MILKDDTDEGCAETTPSRSPAETARPTRTGAAHIVHLIGEHTGQLPVADRCQVCAAPSGAATRASPPPTRQLGRARTVRPGQTSQHRQRGFAGEATANPTVYRALTIVDEVREEIG